MVRIKKPTRDTSKTVSIKDNDQFFEIPQHFNDEKEKWNFLV